MMTKRLLIRDLTLRDGQQSLFATRMNQRQVDQVLPYFAKAGFYAMEVWGGAVPDSVMRYLHEDPWERLEKIHTAIGDNSLLTALSRGRNLFGYNPYPDEVIEGFNRNAIQSGIGIMRIFDALNDIENMRSTIRFVKENGGLADCCIVYTVDPKYKIRDRFRALLHAKMHMPEIFTYEYFVEKAVKLQEMGADMISIKDMAGLATPGRTAQLVSMLKANLSIPLDFHTHCTPGYGLASVLMAIVNGADIVDTSIMNFAGGTSAPAYELVQIFCDKMKIETGIDPEAVQKINTELFEIRKELADFDAVKQFPREYDFIHDKLPAEIDQLFNKAINMAVAGKDEELLEICHQIENWFGFPEPDDIIRKAEIPGGMYSNMLAQLKQLKLEKLLPRALELIPMVRLSSGCPPLVTPTSQIVGVQAVNCAIDEEKEVPLFTTKSIQYVNLVKGSYGKTPVPVDPEFRFKIAAVKEETPYNPQFYKKQENPVFNEYGGVKLAKNEKEELLLELFPSVAQDFLKKKVEEAYIADIHAVEAEKQRKIDEEKQEYNSLTPEERQKRLIDGLYHYEWTSFDEEGVGHS